jgi:hypothetical protein
MTKGVISQPIVLSIHPSPEASNRDPSALHDKLSSANQTHWHEHHLRPCVWSREGISCAYMRDSSSLEVYPLLAYPSLMSVSARVLGFPAASHTVPQCLSQFDVIPMNGMGVHTWPQYIETE